MIEYFLLSLVGELEEDHLAIENLMVIGSALDCSFEERSSLIYWNKMTSRNVVLGLLSEGKKFNEANFGVGDDKTGFFIWHSAWWILRMTFSLSLEGRMKLSCYLWRRHGGKSGRL